ncbi:FAD-dependent oxidoreductase [Spongiactinospora sp. TRM90649]|uniref:NAD(P)/FAD-dependent oxidoreductase n=1 Tax=Spongiactinospora sp. TRM90649 TaxID=3031114 RepID=UPI0023F7BDE2|nr:FAD-dependent oxidoreductase [Spongiactinospora sp. TRM90649]MDF5757761.1 FAD-dependent oxidoreductase [Spongiactinospora sp. TRM90649]
MKSAVVVGAGIWGTSLALALAERGWRVTLVEQYQPGHLRQASAGETRLLRSAHGADEWYARMAWQARERWLALGRRVGEELFVESGMLWFARRVDGWERESARALERLDIPCQIWEPGRPARLFPDYRGGDLAFALWEPKAGVLRARRAVQVTAGLAVDAGVRLVTGRAEPHGGGAVRVGAELIRADRVVWAVGAWLPDVYPEVAEVEVTRQDTLHFAVPKEWRTPPVPAWVDFDGSMYGHGDLGGAGMKVTSDEEGPPYDPDRGDRRVSPRSEQAARAYLRKRFPALAGAHVLLGQVCQYVLTPNAEWIIAEVAENTWVLGGESGHGFKHAPALAVYVAEILEGRREPEARFGLGMRTAGPGLRTSGHTDL